MHGMKNLKYDYEIGFLTLREEVNLKLFENREWKTIFGYNRQ